MRGLLRQQLREGGDAPFHELWIAIWKVWHRAVTESRCAAGLATRTRESTMKTEAVDEFLNLCEEAFSCDVSVETIRAEFLQQAATDPALYTEGYIDIFEQWLGVATHRCLWRRLRRAREVASVGELGLDGVAGAPLRSAGAPGPAVRTHTIFPVQYHELAASSLTLPDFIAEKLAVLQADHGTGYRMSDLKIFDQEGDEVYAFPKEDRFPLAVHYVCQRPDGQSEAPELTKQRCAPGMRRIQLPASSGQHMAACRKTQVSCIPYLNYNIKKGKSGISGENPIPPALRISGIEIPGSKMG